MGASANSKDPDEIRQNAAFHQGLHYLLRQEMHYLEIVTCHPSIYTIDHPD